METVLISKLHGGVSVPQTQTVEVLLPDGHKLMGPGGVPMLAGTPLVVAVVTLPTITGTGSIAEMYLMSPGLPHLLTNGHVSTRKAGRHPAYVVYAGEHKTIADWAVAALREGNHAKCWHHVLEMPAGFAVVSV